jgi:hypothetical protein
LLVGISTVLTKSVENSMRGDFPGHTLAVKATASYAIVALVRTTGSPGVTVANRICTSAQCIIVVIGLIISYVRLISNCRGLPLLLGNNSVLYWISRTATWHGVSAVIVAARAVTR